MSEYVQISIILGTDGKDGEDVPKKKVEELTKLGWKCDNDTITQKKSDFKIEYRFCGTPAIQGSDGGDGGCGGSGGEGGKVQIIGLMDPSNIASLGQNGMEKHSF